jgi:predicted flap endonuclease-1-like 5' DNA nuclease
MNLLVSGLFSTADSYGKGDAIFEIILMLLVAFILGYLLRYFISKNGNEKYSDYDDLSHNNSLLTNQLDVQKNDLKRLQTELENCKQAKMIAFNSDVEPAQKDNLKVVEGIGPKIEQLLYEARIYTWDDLAKAKVSFIQTVLDNAGPNYKVHNPESWPFQAKLAFEEKWEELKKWQDEHKGGRF